jgi:hypothetical protein
MAATYPPPVDQLLTLGDPDVGDEWLDYLALGLGEAHVPALVELIQDPALDWPAWKEGDDEAPFWAPVHAWCALGQLRAPEAAEPLVRVLLRDDDDDWAPGTIPVALAMIGPAALRPIRDALPAAAREPDPSWKVGRLGEALVKIAQAHPEARDEAVALLTRQLRVWPEQDAELNAFLIADLMDLQAVEAAPVMQEAFEGDAVDEAVVGDWEEVQVDLGLLAERITPRPRFVAPLHPFPHRERENAPPAQPSTKAAAKAHNRRKAAKQSRKKNRRRK